jgi:SAM-dependent methyltransferase
VNVTAMTPTPARNLIDLLACPQCHGRLDQRQDEFSCPGCRSTYPTRKGRPVFLPEPTAVKEMPAEHLSNAPPHQVLQQLAELDGWVLNLGAGGTAVKLPNCVEMEYAIFRNTDVVGDAHHLPFGDNSFSAVVTFNTFEHLHDPNRAAEEVYRVLKPGGKLFLHTAFLQPLHEAPHHYYNATEFGVRRWFRDFDIQDLRVSENFQPAYALAWLASELLRAVESEMGTRARKTLEKTPLHFWRQAWQEPRLRTDVRWKLLERISPETQKWFAAGFQLEAKKPAA